jgi:Ca2+-transporting ATPase
VLFNTFGLTLWDWVVVVALAFTVLPVLELVKWIERQGYFGKMD